MQLVNGIFQKLFVHVAVNRYLTLFRAGEGEGGEEDGWHLSYIIAGSSLLCTSWLSSRLSSRRFPAWPSWVVGTTFTFMIQWLWNTFNQDLLNATTLHNFKTWLEIMGYNRYIYIYIFIYIYISVFDADQDCQMDSIYRLMSLIYAFFSSWTLMLKNTWSIRVK